MTTPTPRNKPIEQLLAEYEAEGCNHANTQGVIDSAFRYVDSMEDCQVRCLLYVLARDLAAAQSELAQAKEARQRAEAEGGDKSYDTGFKQDYTRL